MGPTNHSGKGACHMLTLKRWLLPIKPHLIWILYHSKVLHKENPYAL